MSKHVNFAASQALIDALDVDAYVNDTTRSARARTIVAKYLKEIGVLEEYAPVTSQIARNNILSTMPWEDAR